MLQFITHHNDRYGYIEGAEAAIAGGCRWIQLRMKEAGQSELTETGLRLREICNRANATLILDDHVELVDIIGADGVHLGKNDMPVSQARTILGKDKIIGATANTFDDICNAVEQGADYIGLGPFRFTTTKQKLSPVLGYEGYIDIIRQCRDKNISIPIIAIGGITADDIGRLIGTGISGIALSGSILNAENPVSETKRILTLINKNI